MAFKPSEITREHVLKAIEVIKESNEPITDGTKWEVIIEGKGYPPKEVMRFARAQYDGSKEWIRGGGWPTNEFLEKMGFEVREIKNSLEERLIPYIEKYQVLISTSKLYSEIYKWELLTNFKKNWDLNSSNLNEMLDKAFPGNQNLWSSNQYYPIAMLKGFADTNPKGVVEAISNLLDEKLEQSLRITQYRNAMDALLKEDNQKRNLNSKMHYQDGRTIGLLLAFNNPKEHYLFKFNVLKSFCEKFGLKAPKKGDVVNQIKINDEISNQVRSILLEDHELLSIHKERLSDKSYIEDDYHLLTQDFIYSTVTYLKDNIKYYVGGAYWHDNNPQDQTERFLRESIWQNGYEDKFNVIVDSIPEGSLFALKTTDKKGNKMHIKAIGRVVLNHKNGQNLDVEWQVGFTPFVVDFAGGYWETVKEVTNSDHINEIFFHTNEAVIMDNKELKVKTPKPINQILYGPPGTGKTYNTINKALSILETKTEEEINTEKRDVLKARFDDYIKSGQIVFTTFHQSMSYEDFIEGIKPLKPEDEDEFVKYDIEEGIFKGLCRQAIKEFYQKGTNDETFERLNSFENAWNDLLENVQNSIDNNGVFPLDTISGQAMDAFEISNRGNLYLRPQYEGAKDYTVSHDRAQKLFEAFPNLEVVKNIDKEFRSVIGGSNSTAYWSVLNYIITWLNENPTAPSMEQATEISDTLIKFDNKIVKDNISSPVLNYVFIIDEINRGNVSQIFGELITLIEEDKRLGKDEALEIMLPYSKEKFGVPPNLYIVGTMNTADRSVEALDTALRRRFCFEEIEPNSQLIATKGKLKESNGEVEGINLPRVLETINNRIEILSNRDHKIGHSYFMKVTSLADLKATFKKNIIPLLQEYFYNDYEKIGWVVGEGFFVQQKIDKKTIFTKFFKEPKPEFEVAYQLADIGTIDIKKAMLQLLGDYKEETQTENIEN